MFFQVTRKLRGNGNKMVERVECPRCNSSSKGLWKSKNGKQYICGLCISQENDVKDTIKEIDLIGEMLEKKLGKKRLEELLNKIKEDEK